jgi:hypothetical protein
MEEFHARYKQYREMKDGETVTDFDAVTIDEEKELASVDVDHIEPPSVDGTNEEENPMEARELFAEMEKQFGAEIASEVFKSGGGMEEAEALFESNQFSLVVAKRDAYEAENTELKAKVEELEAKLSAGVAGEPEALELGTDDTEVEEPAAPVDCRAKIAEYQTQGLSATEAQDKVLEEYPKEFKAQFYGDK